jgi:hypothetical protein
LKLTKEVVKTRRFCFEILRKMSRDTLENTSLSLCHLVTLSQTTLPPRVLRVTLNSHKKKNI